MKSSLIWVIATLSAVAEEPSAKTDSFVEQARQACEASQASQPVDRISVEPLVAAAGDLAGFTVRDDQSGAWMTVFYDEASQATAARYASCLDAQLRLLHQKTADRRDNARWASVVFTRDAAYVPPRDGSDTRWTIQTRADGAIDAEGLTRLVVTIPHEQVHAFQRRAGAITPRWFHEGHAEWVGRQVTRHISPLHADRHAADAHNALTATSAAVDLDRWGGVAVKREAMLRQLSPADRRRAEADPSFVPAGPFSFGPDDLESDEANAPARYQAAWQVFEALAEGSGDAPVRDWVREVTEASGRVAITQLEETAVSNFGRSLPDRP